MSNVVELQLAIESLLYDCGTTEQVADAKRARDNAFPSFLRLFDGGYVQCHLCNNPLTHNWYAGDDEVGCGTLDGNGCGGTTSDGILTQAAYDDAMVDYILDCAM